MGANLANDNDLRALAERINASVKPWRAAPLVPGAVVSGNALPVTNPADRRQTVGEWQPADSAAVEKALANAVAAQPAWDRTPAASRAAILVANTQFPANTVAELVALAKAKPDSISFASVGNGSPGHLAGELLKLRTGTQMTHVPYRGGGPAVTDVMGGQVPLLWVSIPAAAQFVKAGKLKALAVSTTKRSAAFPDVPTMQEAGVPDFDVDSWYAVFVPAKTPKPAVDRLNRVINTVVKEPEIRDKLLAQGSEGVGGTPEQLGKVVTTELVRWQKLAKEASIKVD